MKKKPSAYKIMQTIKPYLFIAPAIIGLLVFTIYPVIRMIMWSFYDVNQLNPAKTKFVGLKNYTRILGSNDFQKAMVNTGIYTLWTVVFIMLSAVILAVWLNRKRHRLGRFTQTAIYLPHVISMVSIGLIFLQMMNVNNGLFNAVLTFFGFEECKWTTSSSTALMSVIIVAVWKNIGYYTVLVIGALQNIPEDIYEAAALDDAGKIVTLGKITLPMISPQLFFTLIIMTIGSFKVFETIRVMTDGGPNNATTSLVYYIYHQVFMKYDIGRAAASGIVLLVLVGVLTIFYFRSLSNKVHYQ